MRSVPSADRPTDDKEYSMSSHYSILVRLGVVLYHSFGDRGRAPLDLASSVVSCQPTGAVNKSRVSGVVSNAFA